MARVLSKGISLMEVVCSITLLSIILIFVLNLFPTSMATVARSEESQRADLLARGLVEEYSQRDLVVEENAATTLPTQNRGGIAFTPIVEIATPPPFAVTDYSKLLTVTVRWKKRGVHREVVHEQVVTYVRK